MEVGHVTGARAAVDGVTADLVGAGTCVQHGPGVESGWQVVEMCRVAATGRRRAAQVGTRHTRGPMLPPDQDAPSCTSVH